MTTTKKITPAFVILVMINLIAPAEHSYAGIQKQLAVGFTAKNISCNGLHDGNITLVIKGGVAPYKVKWNDGSDALQLNSLATGMYDVTVTDAKGNSAHQSVNITEPYPLSVHGNVVDEHCLGKNGAATILVTGGTYPATFKWSNGSTSQNLENVSAGDYSVNVIDANGCRTNASFNVNRKRVLDVTVDKYNPLCANEGTGLIDLAVKSGTEPYAFAWSNGATTEDVSGLNAGDYSVVITDKNNCTTNVSVSLDNTSPIVIEPVIADADLNKNNGCIALNVSGGAGNYKFLWSTLEETPMIKNLEEDVYAVKVSDANGCFESSFFTVHEYAPLQINANVYNLLCNDDNTGMIDLNSEGGKKPYAIKWSNGLVFEDLSGVAAGTYSVVVTDANLKSITKTFTITQPEVLTVFATVTDETVIGKADGKIKLEIAGGTAPYVYDWVNDNAAQNSNALAPGLYSVAIVDAHQCKIKHEMMVSTQVNDAQAVSETNVYNQMLRLNKNENTDSEEMSIYPNPFSSNITIKFSTAIRNIESIEIFSLEGKLVQKINSSNITPSANSVSINNVNLENGNYFVKVSANGKSYSKIVTKHS